MNYKRFKHWLTMSLRLHAMGHYEEEELADKVMDAIKDSRIFVWNSFYIGVMIGLLIASIYIEIKLK